MLPKELREKLQLKIAEAEHPRELVVDVMYALQCHHGYMSDQALHEGAVLLGMNPLELEEIATFYDFIYREPVGRYIIHVCDGVVCWMHDQQWVTDYLCEKLAVNIGETTEDGLFTLLPTSCIGYCDRAPAVLINGIAYGHLTREKIDRILENLRTKPRPLILCR
jgi:NADH-quinone oxidoreductase subunit E